MFIPKLRWQDVLDIFIIAFIVYKLLILVVGTRAVQLLKGLMVLGLTAAMANLLELKALTWLLSRLFQAMLIAIPILFQPELRRVLEELGRGHLWKMRKGQERLETLAEEVLRAILYLASERIGALLVLQRETGLKEIWRSAVPIKAQPSQELLVSLFWPGNPLHDGAVILDRGTVIAASCYLPLTEKSDLSRWYGTRHRAALGVTEISDAIAIVVSEERGEVSLAVSGRLSKPLKEDQLRKLLIHYFRGKEEPKSFFDRFRQSLNDEELVVEDED
ncbi:diadenylate cyclase CdaA [Thermanaerovibrio acidaminovorans]|uniref:diadenylate cyclase CdaA n=1 Tax=Thermanaerovibrio acidaminovorans TaxID=81462 RepID=UPI002490747A|nr:diadenylate cyclase CdaA [Thermanaerovibrio acidaminovorans]